MFRNSLLLLPILFFISFGTFAQTKPGVKPNFYSKSTSMRVVSPIGSKSILIPAENSNEEIRDGRYSKDNRPSRGKIIIGKGSTGDDILAKAQKSNTLHVPGLAPEIVFDTTEQNSPPTDPSIAVGPDHVLAVFNTGYRIFDKDGNALTDELSSNNIFTAANVCCDLTISYDNAADRWVMSILFFDGSVEVAVSQGPDPINDSWSVYSFAGIDDYQKVSVWSDGYYMTANVNSGSADTANAVFALERDAMLAGAATAQIIGFPLPGILSPPASNGPTGGFFSPQAFNISNDNMPAAGNTPIVYMQDDAYQGVTEDHIKIWTVDVDFNTPANSTISQPTELTTTPFIGVFDGGSFVNLTQPGGQDIDALQNTIMNQAQFRKFPTHNSALFNFVVDTDGGAGEIAGVRWYELRQSDDGQPWTIYQEGTYTSPDGKNAWNASLIMDDNGNIGMGYTGMGGTTDTFVSSYYTGRFANDPLGTMTIDETLIAAGGGNIPGSERYGDYSKIDIDPSNGEKFWFVNEYVNTAGNRANVAGVFQIAPSNTNDVGVVSIDLPQEGSFTNAEDITIQIRNFGVASASNFEVSYQVDGGAVVTETFTGTIESSMIASYTFTQTADLSIEGQTYTITSSTNLTNDELDTNDQTSITVNHLLQNDIGVIAIPTPISGDGLGTEAITITIENFGTQEQSNFDVSYSINGGTAVTETVTGPLAADSTLEYSFTQTVDFSVEGSYEIVAATTLTNDSNTSNDSFTTTIENFTCNTESDATAVAISDNATATITSTIEITDNIIISDINVSLNIEHTWNEDLIITLTAPDNTTQVVLTSGNGGDTDNYTNTVFDDQAANPITGGTGPFTGTFQPEGSLADFDGLSTEGIWTLSIEDTFPEDGGQLLDWSIEFCAVDENILSVNENLAPNSSLEILYKDNNQFNIRLVTSEITETLDLDIYNMLGQRLLNNRIKNTQGSYVYELDMSYAPKGIYLVKLSDRGDKAKIKRLIVR